MFTNGLTLFISIFFSLGLPVVTVAPEQVGWVYSTVKEKKTNFAVHAPRCSFCLSGSSVPKYSAASTLHEFSINISLHDYKPINVPGFQMLRGRQKT